MTIVRHRCLLQSFVRSQGRRDVAAHRVWSDHDPDDSVERLRLAGLVVKPGAERDQAPQMTSAAQNWPAAHQNVAVGQVLN
jgi:hypothetical protein